MNWPLERRRALLACLALFASALLLRLIGVDWHGHHPDEDIAGPARILTGDLRPTAFFYPPLLTYLMALADLPLFAAGLAAGWWHGAAGFRDAYFAAPTPFFVTARLVVAAAAAMLAPLAYLLARHTRLGERAALVVGAIAALLPGAIFWAHIAKSDSALAPAFLFVTLAALRLAERPAIGRAVLLGFAVALSLGVKQSALFFVGPLLAIVVAEALIRMPRPATLGPWLLAGAAAILWWLPMNLGVLLAPRAYLAGQGVQSQMSVRAAPVGEIARLWLAAMTSADTGLPGPVLLACAIAVAAALLLARRPARRLLGLLLAAGLVATLAIGAISGSRQPDHLWLPYVTLLAVAGAIAAMSLAERPRAAERVGGWAVAGLLALACLLRLGPILSQLTAPAQGRAVAAAIERIAPPGTRLLSNVDLSATLPIAPESQRLARARHERIAARYGIALAPPDQPPAGTPGGYVVLDYPFAIGGLEVYRPGEVKTVLPYAWPLQPDEWRLADWRARGFRLFVVRDPAFFDAPIPAYRRFFRALAAECPRAATLPGGRPLLGEVEVRILRCP